MYLYSRQFRLSGSRMHTAITWAIETAEYVKEVTGIPIRVWAQVYSPGANTLNFTCTVPDLAALEGAFDKLMADNHYQELVDTGVTYGIPESLEDHLMTILYPTEQTAPTEMEYVVNVTSTLAAGRMAKGVPAGIELAERVHKTTGAPCLFTVSESGNYGGVAWSTLFPNATAIDQANQALYGDPSFIEFVDANSDCFTSDPMATQQTILRRIL